MNYNKNVFGHVFAQLIQNDLNLVKNNWNTHSIRKSRHDTISGKRHELFFLPERHGGTNNLLVHVSNDEVESLRENLTFL